MDVFAVISSNKFKLPFNTAVAEWTLFVGGGGGGEVCINEKICFFCGLNCMGRLF